MPREIKRPLTTVEEKELNATTNDLSHFASKQALYGIIHRLSLKTELRKEHLKEIIDHARRLTEARTRQGI